VRDSAPATPSENELQRSVYGHTHIPRLKRIEGVWILNPGSPTERRRARYRTMLDVTTNGGRLTYPKVITLP
jgi:predicted phosphodiesterase